MTANRVPVCTILNYFPIVTRVTSKVTSKQTGILTVTDKLDLC